MDSKAGDEVMRTVAELQQNAVGHKWGEYEVALADNFSYHDPVDGSVTKNQVRHHTTRTLSLAESAAQHTHTHNYLAD